MKNSFAFLSFFLFSAVSAPAWSQSAREQGEWLLDNKPAMISEFCAKGLRLNAYGSSNYTTKTRVDTINYAVSIGMSYSGADALYNGIVYAMRRTCPDVW